MKKISPKGQALTLLLFFYYVLGSGEYAKILSGLFGGMPDILVVHIDIICIIMFTRISLLFDI